MVLFLSGRVAAKATCCQAAWWAICGAEAGLPLFAGRGARGRTTYRRRRPAGRALNKV